MMKRILTALILVPIVLVIGFVLGASKLARAAVEEGGTRALGVETTLESVDLELFAGHMALHKLVVRNPEGFEPENLLELERGVFDLDIGSLLDERIVASLLEIEGLHLTLSNSGTRTNFGVILDHLNSGSTNTGDDEKHPSTSKRDDSSAKSFIIDRIVMRDITVAVSVGLLGTASEAKIEIHEIVLDDLASREFTLEELIEFLMRALIKSATENGTGVLSGTSLADLKGRLSGVATAGVQADVEEAKENLRAIKDAGSALKGLFGDN